MTCGNQPATRCLNERVVKSVVSTVLFLLCLATGVNAEDKGVSAERLLKLVQGKSAEAAAARVHAIGAMKTPQATKALIGLTKDDRDSVVTAASQEIAKRVKGEHPSVLPEHETELLEMAARLIRRDQLAAAELTVSQGISIGLQIYRGIGDEDSYATLKPVLDELPYRYLDDEPLTKEFVDTTWFIFCNRSDIPPQDLGPFLADDTQLDVFTFLRLLKTRKDFRPTKWEDTLEHAILSEFVAVRRHAMLHLPDGIGLQTYAAINRNIFGRYGAYPIQIESLEAAARTQSIYFVPSIRKLIADLQTPPKDGLAAKEKLSDEDKTLRNRVLQSARKALKACEPKPLAQPERRTEFPACPLSEIKVTQLMRRVEKLDRVPDAIRQLRELTGLDFGDASDVSSRRAWMVWHSREKSSKRSSEPGDRPFVVYGRITDPEGNPLPGAWAQAYVQTRLHKPGGVRVAYTIADKDGRYVLRYGFGKRKSELPARTSFIDAIDGRRFVLRETDKPPTRIISESKLADDPVLGIKSTNCILPGVPFKQDFTLHPH